MQYLFFIFVWLILVSIIFSRFTHTVVCKRNFIFCVWVIFHFMYIAHYIYPFIFWWALGLFPPAGYCEQCHYEHWHICICFSPFFSVVWGIHLGVELQDHMVILCLKLFEKLWNCFHTGYTIIHPFINVQRSDFSTSVTLVFIKKNW